MEISVICSVLRESYGNVDRLADSRFSKNLEFTAHSKKIQAQMRFLGVQGRIAWNLSPCFEVV
jgi:hypothetical protein